MEVQEESNVVETPAGAGSEATAETTPEGVSSPEVKTEVQSQEKTPENVQKNNVDIAKMQEQIDNLNIALKQEREAGKTASKELVEKLNRSQETIEKLKNVFVPEERVEEKHEALTLEQVQELLDSRDNKQKEELKKEAQAKAVQTEIANLEKQWDGTEGKPKYDDRKVLQWQEDNNKLHLSPSEAFNEMNRDTIIDWEIKNRLAKKPNVQNVETPGGSPNAREPQGASPANTEDLRSAILEAMDIASNDNNN